MKTLILMRHAEADNPIIGTLDFNRSLTHHGKSQAKEMGQWLSRNKLMPNQILVSTATRTMKTVNLLMEVTGAQQTIILPVKELYLASFDAILETLQAIIQTGYDETVLVVAHNPGISNFALSCGCSQTMLQFPNAGLAYFNLEIDTWESFMPNLAKFVSFKSPNN